MYDKEKYKGIGCLVVIFSGIIAAWLVNGLASLSSLLLSIVLTSLMSWGIFTFLFMMLYEAIKKHWPPLGINIFVWFFLACITFSIVFGSVLALLQALEDIQLQTEGVVTTATVTNCYLGSGRNAQFYQIQYQWEVTDVTGSVKNYFDTGETHKYKNTCSSIGSFITIRYLPTSPNVSRLEYQFETKTTSEIIFMPLAMGIFFTLMGPIYLWMKGL